MPVEENKKTHQKWIDDVWMGKNPDSVHEVFGEALTTNWGRGSSITKEQLLEGSRKKKGKIVRTEIHEKFGEGDLLAVWKTQHFSDGHSEEGVTLWKFKDGKITTFKWFPIPSEDDK